MKTDPQFLDLRDRECREGSCGPHVLLVRSTDLPIDGSEWKRHCLGLGVVLGVGGKLEERVTAAAAKEREKAEKKVVRAASGSSGEEMYTVQGLR